MKYSGTNLHHILWQNVRIAYFFAQFMVDAVDLIRLLINALRDDLDSSCSRHEEIVMKPTHCYFMHIPDDCSSSLSYYAY
jgi:hypothetical protein